MADNIKVFPQDQPGAVNVATHESASGVHTPIYATGVVSSGNSSTTALDNGQTFTGEWEEVGHYNSVVVAVKTDQDGYYQVQFSPDGVNQDSTLTRYYRTTNIEPPHRFTITRNYCRVVFYNNSGSNQTYLRLQTMYGDRQELNAPCDSTLAPDFDAIVVRPTDYDTEVALGRRQGAVVWNKFGYNQDVDTATDPEVVAEFGGSFTPLTTATTLSIVSSSTNDDDGGTGANSIVVYGVDANRNEQTEIVTLDGTTPVVTTSTWLGINRMAVYLAGSLLKNDGKITATAVTGGTTQATMPAGEGTTQQCILFTYADHQFLADWMYINTLKQAGVSPVVTIKGWVFSAVSNCKYEVFREGIDTSIDNTIQVLPKEAFVIGEKSVFWLEAETDSNDTIVNARFSGKMIRDVDA